MYARHCENLLSFGQLHITALKGRAPQILINSQKLCFQGWIPENKLDWAIKF